MRETMMMPHATRARTRAHTSGQRYLAEYRRRPTDEAYAKDGSQMCSRLYELGTYDKSKPVTDGEIAVITVEGKSVTYDTTVKIDPPGISRFDETHLDPEPAQDVCRISGFGEAALLLCMRRRLIEKLHIYTYVGDIVLCVNPYMRIPAMEKIHGDRWCPFYVEGEDKKRYTLGSDPHSFAAAYVRLGGDHVFLTRSLIHMKILLIIILPSQYFIHMK
jgi:hypothetical protein